MSWEQLADVWRQNENDFREEMRSEPIACPNDGEPLETGPDGYLFCRFDGWRPSGAPLLG